MSIRKAILLSFAIALLDLPLGYAAQQSQQSVAEAARKAREAKKNQPKPKRVYTNDDLAGLSSSGVSVVGAEPAAEEKPEGAKGEQAKPATGAEKAAPAEAKDEAYWRKRFAEARAKLAQAEKELDILQREFNLKQMQYYTDPSAALKEQYSRKDLNDTQQKIADKQKEVQQLRQGISDLEDELRKSGGDPGWASPPSGASQPQP